MASTISILYSSTICSALKFSVSGDIFDKISKICRRLAFPGGTVAGSSYPYMLSKGLLRSSGNFGFAVITGLSPVDFMCTLERFFRRTGSVLDDCSFDGSKKNNRKMTP